MNISNNIFCYISDICYVFEGRLFLLGEYNYRWWNVSTMNRLIASIGPRVITIREGEKTIGFIGFTLCRLADFLLPVCSSRIAENAGALLNRLFFVTISNGPRLTRVNYLRRWYSAPGRIDPPLSDSFGKLVGRYLIVPLEKGCCCWIFKKFTIVSYRRRIFQFLLSWIFYPSKAVRLKKTKNSYRITVI